MQFLAISGSLRAKSSNTELLRAIAAIARPRATVVLYDGLAALPHFNPDLDAVGAVPPAPVQELRRAIEAADGLLISCPEYAHGVPGSLKNAFDWLVSASELLYKPIGLLNASPQSTFAHAQVAETLRTMSTMLVAGACLDVPLKGRSLDADGITADPALRALLAGALDAMIAAVPASREQRAVLS